jgi:hypothetical protein
MELIPVFAFIVLVASIATFIFSLAAYILYKIREKRGRYAAQPHPKAFKAELVAPNYYYLPQNDDNLDERNKIHEITFDDKNHSNNKFGNYNYQSDISGIDKKNGNELTWR